MRQIYINPKSRVKVIGHVSPKDQIYYSFLDSVIVYKAETDFVSSYTVFVKDKTAYVLRDPEDWVC